MNLSNLIIIVTGASKGIGYTLANLLYEKGATVIGVYNNTKIKDVKYDTFKCDISSEEEIKNLFKYVKDKYKKIDILINCAAISIDDDIYDKSKEDFMKVLEVNLVGTFLMCKYASLLMNKGVIINVSSTDGIDTYNTISVDYCASKAGLINLTKNLANRLPNIKVCGIAPNWIDTDTVLSMDKNYLDSELKRVGQNKLLKKEDVSLKIIEIITNNNIKSGDIIRMD